MREWKGPDGKPVPHHVATALQTVQDWDDAEAAALAARNRGPDAAARYDAIRTQQAQAAAEGRVLPAPPAPVAVAPATDPARMSASERWALMRNTPQSRMPAWRDPRT